MILIRVDLPAPFCPKIAWASPGYKSKFTLSRTEDSKNFFEIF
jgi:hypothetical protein